LNNGREPLYPILNLLSIDAAVTKNEALPAGHLLVADRQCDGGNIGLGGFLGDYRVSPAIGKQHHQIGAGVGGQYLEANSQMLPDFCYQDVVSFPRC
jgi:hypothetical protein